MDIVSLAAWNKPIKSKDDSYYLFKGILSVYAPNEVIKAINVGLRYGGLLFLLIVEKIKEDLDFKKTTEYISSYAKLLSDFKKIKNYYENQRYATIIFEIGQFLPLKNKKEIIKIFFDSDYKNNHKRALSLMLNNWHDSFGNILVRAWGKYKNKKVMETIIKVLPKNILVNMCDELYLYFTENKTSLNYDFSLKLLRNQLFLKIPDKFIEQIDELAESDPISFIFIKKELNKKIEDDFAIKIYNKHFGSRKYLPRWYAEMGMWNVLNKIIKNS